MDKMKLFFCRAQDGNYELSLGNFLFLIIQKKLYTVKFKQSLKALATSQLNSTGNCIRNPARNENKYVKATLIKLRFVSKVEFLKIKKWKKWFLSFTVLSA